MFEFMEKYRAPIMWVCVILMAGFTTWGLLGDLFSSKGPKDREIGTFDIPGEGHVSVMESELRDEAIALESAMGRSEPSQVGSQLGVSVRESGELHWAYYVLRALAKSAGIVVTDEVILSRVNESTKKYDPKAQEMTMRDFRRKIPEHMRVFDKAMLEIRRFRNSVDKAQPEATWDRLYERFKATHEELRAQFVLFDTQAEVVSIDPSKPEDRKKLEEWLAGDANARRQKMVPEQIDADVLYVRYKDRSNDDFLAEFKKSADDRKSWEALAAEFKFDVTDEELRRRFADFRASYEQPLRIAVEDDKKRRAESSPTSTKPADNPTEFDLMRDRLRAEVLVSKIAEKAFAEVARKENPLSLADAAKKYGFRLAPVAKLDSIKIQQQPDFGNVNVALAVFQELREKSLVPPAIWENKSPSLMAKGAIEEPGSSVAIWKITGYSPTREPTIDDPEMTSFVVEKYKEKRRQDLAKERAEAFKKTLDERVAAAVKDKEASLDAGMKAAVETRIKDKSLDRANAEHQPQILDIENEEKQKRDKSLDDERAKHERGAFEALAKEQGLTLYDTDWIRKTANRMATFQASEKLSTAEKAEQFFRKAARSTALAALRKDRIGQVESEPTWFASAVPLLADRRDPKPEDLYTLSKQQLDTLKNQVTPRTSTNSIWTYDNLKKPEWVNLNAPDLDRMLADKAEADKKRAEGARIKEEKKQKDARRKAEDFAKDAINARPLVSGEDW